MAGQGLAVAKHGRAYVTVEEAGDRMPARTSSFAKYSGQESVSASIAARDFLNQSGAVSATAATVS